MLFAYFSQLSGFQLFILMTGCCDKEDAFYGKQQQNAMQNELFSVFFLLIHDIGIL